MPWVKSTAPQQDKNKNKEITNRGLLKERTNREGRKGGRKERSQVW
jgi:hypothetical protein